MAAKNKLGNPFFIIAVIVLVMNDWYLKQSFHNMLTGKLSDVAGLFAFAYFFSALKPRRAVFVHIATLVLFVVWKSPFVQPFIDGLNGLGIPVHRVVDYSDDVALLILPLSYYIFKTSGYYRLRPAIQALIIAFSLFSFVATTMPKGKYSKFTGINKTYSFNFSKRELVSRVNALQLEYVHDFEKIVHGRNNTKGTIARDTARIDFDSKTNTFYYSTTYSRGRDTIAQLLDYERLEGADTIRLRTMHSDINLSGDATHSELKLLSLMQHVRQASKRDDQAEAIGFFEKYVVKKIRSYGK